MFRLMLPLFLLFSSLSLAREDLPPTLPLSPYEEVVPPLEQVETRDFSWEFLKMIGLLALLLISLLLVSWFVKRMMMMRMSSMNVESGIKILEQRPISTKVQIYLIDVRGIGFVIGETPHGIVSLGRVPLEYSDE